MGAPPRRIQKETERLLRGEDAGFTASPHADNPRHFNVVIQGPKDR